MIKSMPPKVEHRLEIYTQADSLWANSTVSRSRSLKYGLVVNSGIGRVKAMSPHVVPNAEHLHGMVPAEVRDRIHSLERKAGWMGRGSMAVSRAACDASIDFLALARRQCKALEMPLIGPSVLGGVALQWKFGKWHFQARISSDEKSIYYQLEGPDYHQDDGVELRSEVIGRLLATRRRACGG